MMDKRLSKAGHNDGRAIVKGRQTIQSNFQQSLRASFTNRATIIINGIRC